MHSADAAEGSENASTLEHQNADSSMPTIRMKDVSPSCFSLQIRLTWMIVFSTAPIEMIAPPTSSAARSPR